MRRLLDLRRAATASCFLGLIAVRVPAQEQEQPHVAIPTIQPQALVPLTNGRYLELTGPEAFGPRVPNVGQYFATVYEVAAPTGTTGTTGTTAGTVGSNFNFLPNPLLGSPSIFAKATFDEGDFHLRYLDFEGSTPANIDIADSTSTAALQYNNANVTVNLSVILTKNGTVTTLTPTPITIPKDKIRVDGNTVRIQFGPKAHTDAPIDGTMATALRTALETQLFPSMEAEDLSIQATIIFGRTPDIIASGSSSSSGSGPTDGSVQDPGLPPPLSPALQAVNTDLKNLKTAVTVAANAHTRAVNGDRDDLVENNARTLEKINTAIYGGNPPPQPPLIPAPNTPDHVMLVNNNLVSAIVTTPGLLNHSTAMAFQNAVTATGQAQTKIVAVKAAARELQNDNQRAQEAQTAFNAGTGTFYDTRTKLEFWTHRATEANAKATQALQDASNALNAMTKAYVAFAQGTAQSETSSLASYPAKVNNSLTLDLGRLAKLSRMRPHVVLAPNGI
jgi:hypothetical protein